MVELNKIKSLSRLQVIDFIKNCHADEDYIFTFKGTFKQAENFIHRMRVDLSRLRTLVRDRGHVPKHFKMLIISIKSNQNNTSQSITLKKAISKHDVSGIIDDIFKEVAGGKVIDEGVPQ